LITPFEVIALKEFKKIIIWTLDSTESKITQASINNRQIAFSTNDGMLFYLDIENGIERKPISTLLEHQVSALDISPFIGEKSSYIAVGFWKSNTVCLLSTRDLSSILNVVSNDGKFLLIRFCSTFFANEKNGRYRLSNDCTRQW
jgi:hypothetical protein